MATVTHRIISNYHTDDRQRLEIETGQVQIHASTSSGAATSTYYDYDAITNRRQNEEDEMIENLWQTENATFGLSKRILKPPIFVPASSAYSSFDDTGGLEFERPMEEEAVEDEEEDIGSWYRSLSRRTGESHSLSSKAAPSSTTISESSSSMLTSSLKPKPHRDKNAWFIARSLPTSSSSTPHPQESLTSTLSRTLPPSPAGEMKVPGGETPPVFLTLGPWNKGYQMLNRYGWEEGEALGLSVRRRGLGFRNVSKQTEEVQAGNRGNGLNRDDAIDLTLSDSDTTMDDDDVVFLQPRQVSPPNAEDTLIEMEDISNDFNRHSDSMALITPLRATLKSDRLGIGLIPKSKHKHINFRSSLLSAKNSHSHRHHHQQSKPSSRIPPQSQHSTPAEQLGLSLFRASFKNVPTSDDLSSHSRKEKEKASRLKIGRGRRGFERMKKKEEMYRRNLLAYLNE